MPGTVAPHTRRRLSDADHADENCSANVSHVHITQDSEDAIAKVYKVLSRQPPSQYPNTHQDFNEFLQKENKELKKVGRAPARLGVCFKDLSTWGAGGQHAPVKTLKQALWRTLTGQDIYEWTLKRLISRPRPEEGRPLIRNFSGVVRSGEIMLVLGRPGSGCSTFLRTIANDHASFLGVTGSLDYSGLTPQEILDKYRGEVAYTPEDDVHFPTLTVRQTLEFALESKTPKRHRADIPRYIEMFARVFGISHVLNTLVGDEYIRGVSGGERKRVSIIESLAANSSVVAWDNSTRGLDAASALDYARSLRILTDTCGKATIVSLYQVSDAIYNLADNLLLIEEGRMIFQGPAQLAKTYFESLGYECQERQTTADFLASVTSVSERRFRKGFESRAPKGASELEKVFRSSKFYQDVQKRIFQYEAGLSDPNAQDAVDSTEDLNLESFKVSVRASKSRYVPPNSSYSTSFLRQVYICTKRELWQLKGNPTPFYVKTISTIVNALIIGSMFYDQPTTSDGAFSRGGFMFYSSILLGWIQLAELEHEFHGRDIINRQKRFAFVKPSSVSLARVFVDLLVVLVQAVLYSVIAYFLAGMQQLPGPFFTFVLFIYLTSICMTAQYRFIGSMSPNFEVALRYCGVLLLIYIIWGGYVISGENLMSQVPWFGWISYLLPITYTFEAVMATEFHGLDLNCSPSSIIPQGLGYQETAYQSCAIAGSASGSLKLSGDSYVLESFRFLYSHVWRNFGILLLFTIAFIIFAAWFSELFEWSQGGGGAIEYKKTTKPKADRSKGKDEEENPVDFDDRAPTAVTDRTILEDSEAPPNLAISQSTFTWHDISYTIPYDGSTRTLLNKISGYCAPGQMTALVGSSGAGKTTLLKALSQRQRVGELNGDMLLDGIPLGSDFQRKIGFCEQMDVHDESSTIREAFEFSALLRQPAYVPRAEKLAYVQTVLEMLELVEMQDAIIWSLPLEQKKRTTIGVELCAKPTNVLFLDEPTSGLDGQGALNILNTLKRLSGAGLAIICTIHQATQQQFTLFDKVLALNPGGNTFYFGDIGHSGETIFKYFAAHSVPIADGKNVADFLIEVGVGVLKPTSGATIDFNEVWRNSSEAQTLKMDIENICGRAKSSSQEPPPASGSSSDFSASTFQQTVLLTKRVSRQYWRTPEYPYSRLYGSFLHAVLNGFTFFQLGNGIIDMQSRMFSCFLILMLVPEFMNATSMRFIANRDIWEAREYPSRLYGWVAFTVAQIVSELPYAVVGAVIFFMLFYFPVGLPLGLPAGYTFLMVLFFHLFATSWGQWVGALSKDATVAANLMPFMVIMCELFNGVLRPQMEMPVVWRYTMYYAAPFTYWIGGILSTVLAGQPIICAENDLSFFVPPEGQTCAMYAEAWLSSTTGYLVDPGSTARLPRRTKPRRLKGLALLWDIYRICCL
ncbi:hypothetical protein V491_04960 [Pseudogymnoascus sp. VKM F-3775]|nr:hypothetical protein V491_04960 [Pseudogymnoascus sp. VKM F-3775]